MAFFSGTVNEIDINEMKTTDLRFDITFLKNLSIEENWDMSGLGLTDYSYLCGKVANKYKSIIITIVDRNHPGKTLYSLGYRFNTDTDKLAFILKFS